MTHGEPPLLDDAAALGLDHPDLTLRTLLAGSALLPEASLGLVASLRGDLDAVELHVVRALVRDGATWPAVAAALGTTRQAAHRRFSRRV